MDKKELQIKALRFFNKGCVNAIDVMYHNDLCIATDKECCYYMDCVEEIFRAGRSAYTKRYRL